MYSYSTKVYSSRDIECHCREDIAYRVLTANRVPDHSSVARFVVRHEGPLAELFGGVLKLCERAGLVGLGVVAIDGTKMPANASRDANVDYDRIAREIIAEAIATDQAEDELHGDARGDELPEELATEEGRRAWLACELAADRDAEHDGDGEHDADGDGDGEPEHRFDAEEIVARVQGRDGWLLEAKRQLDQERWQTAGPVPRSRTERLRDVAGRLEQDLAAVRRGNEAYEQWRETAVDRLGRRLACRPPKPFEPPASPQGRSI